MEQRKENKMGTMPVPKLLLTMSFPIMISMIVQALYNVVDSIFVAQLGENALTAVSLAFPIQNLMIAIGVGTGVGINSILSRKLGEKHFDDANLVASNGIFLGVLSWILFALFGLTLVKPFFSAFTDNAEIMRMGTDYLSICTLFSFGVFLQIAAERIMQSTGNTLYNMFIQGAGAIINIILDPILIFGLLGAPKLGVAGAAIATVIGQIFAMSLGLYLAFNKIHDVKLSFKGFRPNIRIIKEIYAVGLPSIIMQSIASIMTFGLNKILVLFSVTAVSVFGVYFKLQSFVFMPVFGITSALIPIAAFNYGARKKERIIAATKLSAIAAFSIMMIGLILFQIIPDKLLLMFNASEDMLKIGVPALRIISLSFIFAGISIVLSSLFQALGHGILSMIVSIVRQLVLILPLCYILARILGLNYLWLAFPISEIFSITLSLFMFRFIYNKQIKHI